jgi:hypothetical protein
VRRESLKREGKVRSSPLGLEMAIIRTVVPKVYDHKVKDSHQGRRQNSIPRNGDGTQGLNSAALPLEPHFQSSLFWLFWRWGNLSNYLSRLASNCNPPDLSLSNN